MTRSRTMQLILDDIGIFMLVLVTALILVLAAVFVVHRNAVPLPRNSTVSTIAAS